MAAVDMQLKKGEKKELPQHCRNVEIGLKWEIPDGSVDLDASVIMYDKDGNVFDTVSYSKLRSKDGGVVHMGDNTTGQGQEGADNETIRIRLGMLDKKISSIFCVVCAYTANKTFDDVEAVKVTLRQYIDKEESCFPCIKGPTCCCIFPMPQAPSCRAVCAPALAISKMFGSIVSKLTSCCKCCKPPGNPLDGFFGTRLPCGQDGYTGMVALKFWREGDAPTGCIPDVGTWKVMQVNHKEAETGKEDGEGPNKTWQDMEPYTREMLDDDFSASDADSDDEEESEPESS